MDLTGKRLLVLGGASVHCKVVEAAKRLGVYTIVADYLIDSPAKRIADESLLISILDVDAIVDWCEKNPVDGVINYCNDPAQKAHQEICERLGLPCYGESVKQIAPLTNKTEFKRMCQECGVGIIPSYTENDVIEGTIEYPVLVKPSDSRGSRGQTICYTKEEAFKGIEFARSESFTGNVIIEKYMGGCDDLELSYVVVDGTPFHIKIEDRYSGDKSTKLDKLCIAVVWPSLHEVEYREKVDIKVCNMIKKMGIKNAPIMLQGFWDNGDVCFYDPGIRIPGDDFDLAYFAATGIDIPEQFVRYAVTGSFTDDFAQRLKNEKRTKVMAQIFPGVRPGTIAKIKGIDEIKKNPAFLRDTYFYSEGDTVGEHNDVKQRFAEFVIACDNMVELKESIDWLFATLKVEDTNGNEQLFAKLDTNVMIKYI